MVDLATGLVAPNFSYGSESVLILMGNEWDKNGANYESEEADNCVMGLLICGGPKWMRLNGL